MSIISFKEKTIIIHSNRFYLMRTSEMSYILYSLFHLIFKKTLRDIDSPTLILKLGKTMLKIFQLFQFKELTNAIYQSEPRLLELKSPYSLRHYEPLEYDLCFILKQFIINEGHG